MGNGVFQKQIARGSFARFFFGTVGRLRLTHLRSVVPGTMVYMNLSNRKTNAIRFQRRKSSTIAITVFVLIPFNHLKIQTDRLHLVPSWMNSSVSRNITKHNSHKKSMQCYNRCMEFCGAVVSSTTSPHPEATRVEAGPERPGLLAPQTLPTHGGYDTWWGSEAA